MPAEEKRISERATAAVHLIEEGRRMGKMASGEGSWINVMLARPENEMLCLVDHSFIIDTFNLYGLRHMIPQYDKCLAVLCGKQPATEDVSVTNSPKSERYASIRDLYGLIHARFILTVAGLQAMYIKYKRGEFRTCMYFPCNEERLLPCGLYPELDRAAVIGFCPKCELIYRYQPSRKRGNSGSASSTGGDGSNYISEGALLDGAYFGATFTHMFFMQYPKAVPKPPSTVYVPRVYGFRVHESSASRHNGPKASVPGALQRSRMPRVGKTDVIEKAKKPHYLYDPKKRNQSVSTGGGGASSAASVSNRSQVSRSTNGGGASIGGSSPTSKRGRGTSKVSTTSVLNKKGISGGGAGLNTRQVNISSSNISVKEEEGEDDEGEGSKQDEATGGVNSSTRRVTRLSSREAQVGSGQEAEVTSGGRKRNRSTSESSVARNRRARKSSI